MKRQRDKQSQGSREEKERDFCGAKKRQKDKQMKRQKDKKNLWWGKAPKAKPEGRSLKGEAQDEIEKGQDEEGQDEKGRDRKGQVKKGQDKKRQKDEKTLR